ncbi:MAG: hypothetical protein R2856_07340 [Caldilineaceae bacterium]
MDPRHPLDGEDDLRPHEHSPREDTPEPLAALPPRQDKRLSRRRFLRMAGWSAVGVIGAQTGLFRVASAIDAPPDPGFLAPPPTFQPSYVSYLRRRNDLLDLRLEFYNMQRVAQQGGGSVMQRINANQNAYMVVHFPPQATAERAFGINDNLLRRWAI